MKAIASVSRVNRFPKGSGKRALTVARQIVEDIEQQGAEVGDRLLPEQEMLVRYGVARATLREALRFLELQGIIFLRPGPGGGPVVQEPRPKDFASTMALLLQFLGTTFRSLIEVRQAVGPTMAALAAERASDEDIDKLNTSLATLKTLSVSCDSYAEENRRFHDVLAWASGNPLIGFLIGSLHNITNASEVGIIYTEGERDYQIKAYGRLLKAIEDRNPDLAFTEMSRFISRSDKYLEARYPDIMSKIVRWQDADDLSVPRVPRRKR